MNTRKTRVWLQVSALAAVLALAGLEAGCVVAAAGAAAGAGTVAFVEGKLVVTVDSPYNNTVRATDQAIAQLQFLKLTDRRDDLTATLTARTAQDKKVTVDVERQADHLTKLEIRVDTFGDKALSQTIYERIRSNL